MFESHLKQPISFPTLTGSIVTFNSQYAGLPLKSHTVAVTATQSGSGTPSPSNPRPISGYSAINISQSGADTSTPTVYVINLGGTYYGGEYDARTGVLTVTHGIVDLGNINWQNFSSANKMIFSIFPQAKKPINNSKKANIFCEIFDAISRNDAGYSPPFTKTGIGIDGDGYLFIQAPNSTWTNISDAVAEITGYKLVYELAEPIEIQLPPCPIDTLELNNIWADTGDTTLQYIKLG